MVVFSIQKEQWSRVNVAKQAGNGKDMMFGTCDRRILKNGNVQEKNCRFNMKPGYVNFYESPGLLIRTYRDLYEAKLGFR